MRRGGRRVRRRRRRQQRRGVYGRVSAGVLERECAPMAGGWVRRDEKKKGWQVVEHKSGHGTSHVYRAHSDGSTGKPCATLAAVTEAPAPAAMNEPRLSWLTGWLTDWLAYLLAVNFSLVRSDLHLRFSFCSSFSSLFLRLFLPLTLSLSTSPPRCTPSVAMFLSLFPSRDSRVPLRVAPPVIASFE